jgi:hypothetical protein
MKRYFRGVLTIWLILLASGAGVVLVARAGDTRDTLRELGFDLCGGEPCWRGLKPGMPWNNVKGMQLATFTDPRSPNLNYVQWHTNSAVVVFASSDMSVVERVFTATYSPPYRLPITAGQIVAQYGPPCRVEETYGTNGSALRLIYPAITAVVPFNGSFQNGYAYVTPDSPLTFFYLWKAQQDLCPSGPRVTPGAWYGDWQGFATYDVYHIRSYRTRPIARLQ